MTPAKRVVIEAQLGPPLERDGLIDIHLVQRTYIGRLFIDGYSVVVWSPRLAASA
jgi:hypothetical protein